LEEKKKKDFRLPRATLDLQEGKKKAISGKKESAEPRGGEKACRLFRKKKRGVTPRSNRKETTIEKRRGFSIFQESKGKGKKEVRLPRAKRGRIEGHTPRREEGGEEKAKQGIRSRKGKKLFFDSARKAYDPGARRGESSTPKEGGEKAPFIQCSRGVEAPYRS